MKTVLHKKAVFLLAGLLPVASLQGDDISVSSNPGAVNLATGTGILGEKLFGFKKDSGIRLGGLWIPDYNYLFRGGLHPHRGGGNNLFQLMLTLDMEKLHLWKGGMFGVEFLQYNGSPVNTDAGTVQGYNSLQALPPLHRSELYQIWLLQSFFNNKFVVRLGKSIPSLDFNNVLKPIAFQAANLDVPSTTSVIYTPIYVNSSMLGVLPGYYDSAYGITLSFLPTKQFYFSYGLYDGNLARNVPTGLRGPEFNGYYFQIGEVGGWWKFKELPGSLGIGGWGQSGKLTTLGLHHRPIVENGIQGLYLFGTQRLWLQHPKKEKDTSGIIGFIQYGTNNSKILPINKFYGGGLTFIGLFPGRALDTFGGGFAWGILNHKLFQRKSELILQAFNQTHLFSTVFFLGALTYIPTPGAPNPLGRHNLPSAWAATGRIIALF